MSGFVEILWQRSAATVAVHPITPELDAAIREVGQDPSKFNRMVWPAGASRNASGFFILHQTLVADIYGTLGHSVTDPVGFRMDGITFDKVYLRNPVPLLTSEGSGALFSVEVVDDRFFWPGHEAVSMNVSTHDKEDIYDSTEVSPGTPYTYLDGITKQFEQIGVTASEIEYPDTGTDPELLDDEWRELTTTKLNASDAIDQLLADSGHILVAFPNLDYSATTGRRYQVKPINGGEAEVAAVLSQLTDDLIAGGIYSPSGDYAYPTSGAGSVAAGATEYLNPEVPSSISVNFPKATVDGTGYKFDQASSTAYPVDRFETVVSSSGLPAGVTGDTQTFSVFDSKWAIVDAAGNPTNQAELDTRAALVAERYYARFVSGVGNMLFRGIQPIVPWSGAHEIVWSLRESGPYTRVMGSYDSTLYGFSLDTTLTASRIMTTGTTRMIPRPDGGVLLDSVAAVGQSVFTIQISTNVQDGANRRWFYNFDEVQPTSSTSWEIVTGGLNNTSGYGPAVNTVEANNSTSGLQGNGVVLPLPDGFDIVPIGIGAVTTMWLRPTTTGGNIPIFSLVNQVDGECSLDAGAYPTRTITVDTVLSLEDTIVEVDASAGDVRVELPLASSVPSGAKLVTVKKVDSTTSVVTVVGNAADVGGIDGLTAYDLTFDGDSVSLLSSSSSWIIQ